MLSSLKKFSNLNLFNTFKFTQNKTTNDLFKTSKKYFPKNEKAIKNRMKSVGSIAKITKAMKMVRNMFYFRCPLVR